MSFRYQMQTLYAEKKGVRTFEGVDPITGLPVLIYEFQGEPREHFKKLESENIPGLLESYAADPYRLVMAYSKRYKTVSKPFRVPISLLLIESARALRDAARVAVVHGDIRPERFLSTQDHVLLEGFGVPWLASENPYRAPETKVANLKDDIYAWAKSIFDIVSGDLSDSYSELLTQCLLANPNERLDAESLYNALQQLLKHETLANKTSVHNFELSFDESSMTQAGFQEAMPAASSLAANTKALAQPPAKPAKASEETAETSKTFVKSLPPGASYKPGDSFGNTNPYKAKLEQDLAELRTELASDGSNKRRSLMFIALIVAVLLLAGLAMFNQVFFSQPLSQAASGNVLSQYIVELDIQPTDLPPIDIVVISSPAGSARPANSLLGKYNPGANQIALNKEGLWQLQGRFNDRVSEVVNLQLPEQRRILITIPPAETP